MDAPAGSPRDAQTVERESRDAVARFIERDLNMTPAKAFEAVGELFSFLRVLDGASEPMESLAVPPPLDPVWRAFVLHSRLYDEFCKTCLPVGKQFVPYAVAYIFDPMQTQEIRYANTFSAYKRVLRTEPQGEFWPPCFSRLRDKLLPAAELNALRISRTAHDEAVLSAYMSSAPVPDDLKEYCRIPVHEVVLPDGHRLAPEFTLRVCKPSLTVQALRKTVAKKIGRDDFVLFNASLGGVLNNDMAVGNVPSHMWITTGITVRFFGQARVAQPGARQ